jgi:hypothetical protein
MITAFEAKNLTAKDNDVPHIELDIGLLTAIDERIKNAASLGKHSITLSSITDCGNGIRGIGHYLSEGVTAKLCGLLIEKGFKVVMEHPFGDENLLKVIVSW